MLLASPKIREGSQKLCKFKRTLNRLRNALVFASRRDHARAFLFHFAIIHGRRLIIRDLLYLCTLRPLDTTERTDFLDSFAAPLDPFFSAAYTRTQKRV